MTNEIVAAVVSRPAGHSKFQHLKVYQRDRPIIMLSLDDRGTS
jgi:hypothetical protein